MLKRCSKLVILAALFLAAITCTTFSAQAEEAVDFNQQTITIVVKEKSVVNPSVTEKPMGGILPSTGEIKLIALSLVGMVVLVGTIITVIYRSNRRRHLHEK